MPCMWEPVWAGTTCIGTAIIFPMHMKQLAVMIVLSLYMGLTSSGVDNAAHVAGLILGILLGILLYRKPKKKMDDGGVWNER